MPISTNKHIAKLRDDLLTAQSRLTREKSAALAVVVTGMPTAGRSEVVNQLLEWLDPKHIKVRAFGESRNAAACAPLLRRYWENLPARGEIAIYFLGWYADYLLPALHSPKKAQRQEPRVIARIKQLEAMLYRDRIRVLKLDLRVDRKTQKRRIAALRADKATRWRLSREERWLAKHYARVRKTTDRVIAATDSPLARWHVLDGADSEQRVLEAGSLMLDALRKVFRDGKRTAARAPTSAAAKFAKKVVSATQAQPLDDDVYERERERLQGRLARLTRKRAFANRSVVLAFEGMDAAGKGGAIRKLTTALDARQYTVIPVSAPTPEELSHPYLWRFWRNLPECSEFAIFDRSWYGRVLVERVRAFTPEPDWSRAYDEINEFELQLAESGAIVRKFWLAVSKAEQLQRLKVREDDRLKRFKVDKEDWVNRGFYEQYQVAADEMIQRTNTAYAPWVVVAADDKKSARLQVLGAVCDAIEKQLGQ
jgi:AMP-polyphosphate phosphotransferase